MKPSEIFGYYNRPEVREKLLSIAKNREFIPRYLGDIYGKRPDIVSFDKELLDMVKKNATSFHISEERWSNPISISKEMKPEEFDELRIGWDFIMDIDSKCFEYTTICAELVVELLKHYDINCYSIKFSGNKGWHIGIPFEAFPKYIGNEKIESLFPKAPRIMADFVMHKILDFLIERMANFENGDMGKVLQKLGKKDVNEIKDPKGEVDPYSFMEVDTILISPRHLFRAPYSFNEKSWLISVPIRDKDFDRFRTKADAIINAAPNNVNTEIGFLDKKPEGFEATRLISEAFDWLSGKERRETEKKKEMLSNREYRKPENAVSKDIFPPCIRKMLDGNMTDGKKRGLFAIINFFKSMGWDWPQIMEEINSWNQKNNPNLPDAYINSQVEFAKKGNYRTPNCSNANYYKDVGVCNPDGVCAKITNPSSYPMIKMRMIKDAGSKGSRKQK